ncbi:hypothetical protein [Enterovirga rhinocerotis]|nr:hypothetical protein [Enterovirga rhinocerotis]
MPTIRNPLLIPPLALALAAVAAVAGCSTATPVLLQGTSLPTLQGRANTTAGYTGELTTDNGACRGSFTGFPGHPVVTLEVSCNDGRSGIGTATLASGAFVSGEVRLNDGSLLTIRQRSPAVP